MKLLEKIKIYPRHQLDIQISDLMGALMSFLAPLDRQQLEKDILSFWESKNHRKICFTVRTAFDSLLTGLNFPKGTEVMMTAVNIKHMVEIVEHHELKVIPLDFQIEDLSLDFDRFESLISEKTKVILFAQLFGAIVDLQPLSERCKQHGILLIEDCAQAFCGTKYQGSSFADVSLFSFGPIKSSTALGGAVVIARSAEFIEKIEEAERTYHRKSEYWFLRRVVKYLLVKLLSFPIIYGLFLRLLSLLGYDLEETINRVSRSFSKGPLISQIRFQPPVHLLFLLHRRFYRNNDSKFGAREKKVRFLLESLETLKTSIQIPSQGVGHHSFWVIPLLTENPNLLRKELLEYGFDSTQAHHSQTAITAIEDGIDIKNAQYLLNQTIYLPSMAGMNETVTKQLISILVRSIGDQKQS